MTKQNTDDPRFVAASPMVHEPGLLPFRIVIRDLGDQNVVHTQVFEPGKKPCHQQGDYFLKRGDSVSCEASDADALRRAWSRFEERVRRSLSTDPPPARRLAEVSNIAESIINSLLAGDEEDRRDVISEGDLLQSDIEKFENFAGEA